MRLPFAAMLLLIVIGGCSNTLYEAKDYGSDLNAEVTVTGPAHVDFGQKTRDGHHAGKW